MSAIAELNYFAAPGTNSYLEFEAFGREFAVQRFGFDGELAGLLEVLFSLRNQVQAFALSGLPSAFRHRLWSVPVSVPVCDGRRLEARCTVNRLREEVAAGRIDVSKGCFFPLSSPHTAAFRFLGERAPEQVMAGDLCLLLGVDQVVGYGSHQAKVLPWGLTANSLLGHKPTRPRRLPLPSEFEYVYTAPDSFSFLDCQQPALLDRTWILAASDPHLEKAIAALSPREVIRLFPESWGLGPYLSYSIVEAAMRLALDHRTPVPEVRPSARSWSDRAAWTVAKKVGGGPRRADPDFAFILHPLSNRQVFQIPGLGALGKLPDPAKDWVERQVARAPGFLYGHLDEVVSASTGREVSGLIYCLPATPRTLLEQDVQATYAQINAVCEHAAGAGAKIIGLGAYTKIVGDAGVSINRISPIPVTTGNSLSASATLWAVHEVSRKMGLLKALPGGRRFDGVAMVVGASGSIGRVCAKLLAFAFRRVVLVAPRVDRLREIAREIGEIDSGCEIIVATSADEWAALADVIVTATSSRGQRVLDVARLKPGAIICDCSRPLDFTIEDAMARPDVLIIESGEVVLPGPATLDCYLGLPDGAVWACLGETALLALAGRYEAFSLGRDLDWRRVKEIYRLAREHGVGLAAIRGHAGAITDREIALTRALALKGTGVRR